MARKNKKTTKEARENIQVLKCIIYENFNVTVFDFTVYKTVYTLYQYRNKFHIANNLLVTVGPTALVQGGETNKKVLWWVQKKHSQKHSVFQCTKNAINTNATA